MPDNRSSALLEIAACAVKTRRDLHRLPELDMIEFRTASIVAERLMALGLEIKLGREVMDATCRRMRCCVRRWEPGVASEAPNAERRGSTRGTRASGRRAEAARSVWMPCAREGRRPLAK